MRTWQGAELCRICREAIRESREQSAKHEQRLKRIASTIGMDESKGTGSVLPAGRLIQIPKHGRTEFLEILTGKKIEA